MPFGFHPELAFNFAGIPKIRCTAIPNRTLT
jgi:hypothetical protein